MKCPSCGHHEMVVKDSRPVQFTSGNHDRLPLGSIRRLRCCENCKERITTFEVMMRGVDILSPGLVLMMRPDGLLERLPEAADLSALVNTLERTAATLRKSLPYDITCLVSAERGPE